MAFKTKTTSKQTKSKKNAVNPKKAGSGGGVLRKLIEMVKSHAIPALAAVGVVAFASGIAPTKLGTDGKEEKFNLTRTAVAGILPVIAGKVLKRWIKPAMVEKIMVWSLALSLIWDGAKFALEKFGITRQIMDNATKLGSKVSIPGIQKGTSGVIKRNVGTAAMPSQRVTDRSHNEQRGAGDVMQGYRGPEITRQVTNFQRT